MSIRQFKPVTPGTRFRSVADFAEITRSEPEPSLLEPLTKSGGRNNQGHITTRWRGGGHKRRYRRIDFRRNKFAIPARVSSVEYDPNRTARIALLTYADGEKRYILHPKGLNVGDTVVSGPGSDIRVGNAMPLFEIPLGTAVHNLELKIGRGGQLCRSAGTSAQVVAKEGNYVTLRLRSRDADDPGRVPRHGGGSGQRGPRAAFRRQGREDPLAGPQSPGARRGDESGGPPVGRRRGQELRRPAGVQSVGQAGRPEDTRQEEGEHETGCQGTETGNGDAMNGEFGIGNVE